MALTSPDRFDRPSPFRGVAKQRTGACLRFAVPKRLRLPDGPTADRARQGVKCAPMTEVAPGPTELLLAWGRGDRAALDRLVPMVHRELKGMARGLMARERPHHTIQATALVNEA